MKQFTVRPIGTIVVNEEGMFVRVDEEYLPALQALEGFGHINVVWWFSRCDNREARGVLEVEAPYKKSPEVVGTFATRSEQRPNPIALSVCQVLSLDRETGLIRLAYTDAEDGTPVLDLKPYTPSVDRVEHPRTPDWCAHWPACVEQSGEFDWEDEFNF